ncbi:MAG TPA: hypothetical protein P5136_02685 [Methanofastidiosum sp.]|nr:hypothetical protein [Methanofastidiosum sp.]
MIKKLFCLFLSFCLFSLGCTSVGIVNMDDYDCAKGTPTVKKGKAYDIYYKEKYCTSLSIKQWEALIAAAGQQAELTKAEEAKVRRVYAELEDDPWVIPLKGKLKTKINILWKNEKAETIKKVTINLILQRENKDDPCRTIKIYAYVTTAVAITVILVLVFVLLKVVDAEKNSSNMEVCYGTR